MTVVRSPGKCLVPHLSPVTRLLLQVSLLISGECLISFVRGQWEMCSVTQLFADFCVDDLPNE